MSPCDQIFVSFADLVFLHFLISSLFGQWPHPMQRAQSLLQNSVVGLVCKIGLVILLKLPRNKEIDAKLTQTRVLCQQRLLDSIYSELMIQNETSGFIWNQYSWKYFCVKWATLSDADPDTGQTGHTEVEAGPGWQRLPWSHQLRPLCWVPQTWITSLDKSNFQWVLPILSCRERDGANLTFCW